MLGLLAAWTPFEVCRMFVIFSSRIRFSRSISVYLSTRQLDDSQFQLTFEHLCFLGFGAEMTVVLGCNRRLDGCTCIFEFLFVNLEVTVLPFPLKDLGWSGLGSEHATGITFI